MRSAPKLLQTLHLLMARSYREGCFGVRQMGARCGGFSHSRMAKSMKTAARPEATAESNARTEGPPNDKHT